MALFKKSEVSPQVAQMQAQMMQQTEAEMAYRRGIVNLRDIIAPPSFEIESNYLKIGKTYARTLFVYGYPRTLFTGWL